MPKEFGRTEKKRLRDVEDRLRRTVGMASQVITINGAVVSNDTPQPIGTASAGASTEASRSDHVHANNSNGLTADIIITLDGGGSALTTDPVWDGVIDFACTIQSATLLADQSGSAVLDVQKDTYANYPPTGGDSICASAKPTISTATKSQDTTLTGWTTSITAGDCLRVVVDSTATVERLTLILKVTKT